MRGTYCENEIAGVLPGLRNVMLSKRDNWFPNLLQPEFLFWTPDLGSHRHPARCKRTALMRMAAVNFALQARSRKLRRVEARPKGVRQVAW